jgi:hypothetical protein
MEDQVMAVPDPVMRAAGRAFRDLYRAFWAMPQIALVGLVIAVGFGVLEAAVRPPRAEGDAGVLLDLVLFSGGLLWNFLFAPVFIALHRFIILHEITGRYVLAPNDPRLMRYFGWSLVVALLTVTPGLLMLLGQDGILVWAAIVLMLGGVYISLRLTILFPAIAVDAPRATFVDAFYDAKGQVWRILAMMLMTSLPMILLALLIFWPASSADAPSPDEPSFVATVLWAVALFLNTALLVSVAARLFEALGERVQRPAVD